MVDDHVIRRRRVDDGPLDEVAPGHRLRGNSDGHEADELLAIDRVRGVVRLAVWNDGDEDDAARCRFTERRHRLAEGDGARGGTVLSVRSDEVDTSSTTLALHD